MALNYERIGWTDAPSTDTPIDSGNLNHMDNGILAVSQAYDQTVPALEENIQTMYGTYNDVLGDFAYNELMDTASRDYVVGDYLILNSKLYNVIASISEGDSFVEDTNIEQTTVADEVNALKTEVSSLETEATGLRTDLGSPSSASGVTGADAFSKINSLNANSLGSRIDISGYTSTSNLYTFPNDGYVVAECSAASNANASIRIYPPDTTSVNFNVGGLGGGTYPVFPCFVKKGMRAQVTLLENSGKAYFVPIT